MKSLLPAVILAVSTTTEHQAQTELEEAYWDCEFTATQEILDTEDALVCSQLYENLKQEKFLGDFDRFLAWWKKNKDRELSKRTEMR